MFLLDTSICLYAIKKRTPLILKMISENRHHGLFISSLTIAELEFGISHSLYPERNRLSLLEFLTIFHILDFCQKDTIPYGMIKTHLKRSGHIIGPIDMLLAAQAVSNSLIMVTNNVKEFERIEHLKIENWTC